MHRIYNRNARCSAWCGDSRIERPRQSIIRRVLGAAGVGDTDGIVQTQTCTPHAIEETQNIWLSSRSLLLFVAGLWKRKSSVLYRGVWQLSGCYTNASDKRRSQVAQLFHIYIEQMGEAKNKIFGCETVFMSSNSRMHHTNISCCWPLAPNETDNGCASPQVHWCMHYQKETTHAPHIPMINEKVVCSELCSIFVDFRRHASKTICYYMWEWTLLWRVSHKISIQIVLFRN